MNIRLVDIDSKIPNLALMQLSSYHKALGDNVGFDVENPDKVYISCVFKDNYSQALGIKTLYPNAEVDLGGSGVDLKKTISTDAQKVYPDYSLYPNIDCSMGFTTRGCIRHCPFCVVPEKEGRIQKWQHVSEFYNPKFKKVHLLDNNMYALKDWFFENTDFILDHKLQLHVSQGFDVRILSEEIAERLAKLKFYSSRITFAFDNLKDEPAVVKGIEMLLQAGINPHNLQFYVLTGFNTSFEEDLYRVNLLRSYGVSAFVMQFKKNTLSKMLARYSNRRWVFYKVPFSEYKPYIEYQKKHNGECY